MYKWLLLCIIQFQVAILHAAADYVEWQWFSKWILSPCGYVHSGSMTVSQTIMLEGSMVTCIQQRFPPLAFLRTEISPWLTDQIFRLGNMPNTIGVMDIWCIYKHLMRGSGSTSTERQRQTINVQLDLILTKCHEVAWVCPWCAYPEAERSIQRAPKQPTGWYITLQHCSLQHKLCNWAYKWSS